MKRKHIIVYAFQSLEDPLMKGLMLEYLKQTGKEHSYHYHLITHEQKHFELTGTKKEKRKYELLHNHHISWHPVSYHSGRFILLKKLFDFLKTFMICLKLKREFKTRLIVGFLPIAGGYSAIISKILRMELVVYCFEPHSEYLADFGTWNRSSLKYKLLRFFEKFQVQNAQYLVVPTFHSEQLVKNLGAKGNLFVCPISVDTTLMKFDEIKRKEIRDKLNCENKTVIIYTGKFNGVYYPSKVILDFFEKLISVSENYFLLVISPDHEQLKKEISVKLASSVIVLPPVPYEHLSSYISAADIGIVAVPPYPSQKYRTPVKTGIYLSCGLPYIVNRGIAEDDLVAENEKVGIVTEDFEKINPNEIHIKITSFIKGDRNQLKNTCRSLAVKTRDTKIAAEILKRIFFDFYSKK